MSAPTLDGNLVFGAAVKMATSDNPRGQQQNAYPGLSGLESLDMGLRGRFTVCSGIHYAGYGNPLSTLGTVQEAFRSYNDGLTHVLVDTRGFTWLNVKLESYQPEGRIMWTMQLGFHQAYTARFLHLT